MAGNWKNYFKNVSPITLELACGKGEYALGLAQLYPDKNFIGVDLKGNRLWVGARQAIAQNLTNLAFLRIQIERITEFFAENEIEEIWITFPDPQLRISKSKKRLTHPKFLRMYQQILQAGGKINLKTDSTDLYRFTKKVIAQYGCKLLEDEPDLYSYKNIRQELQIKTHYEALDIAQSHRIHFLSFSLPPDLPGTESDAILHEQLKHEGIN